MTPYLASFLPLSAKKEKKARKSLKKSIVYYNLDQSLLGDIIAIGRQHYVLQYGERKVVKIPKTSLYVKAYGLLTSDQFVTDHKLLQTYAAEFLPKTTLTTSKNPRRYVIVQDYFPTGIFVTPAIARQENAQFLRLLSANDQLVKNHGLSIDFFGNIGFGQSVRASLTRNHDSAILSNVLAIPTPTGYNLKLVDFDLLVLFPPWKANINLFHSVADIASFGIMQFLITDHFS